MGLETATPRSARSVLPRLAGASAALVFVLLVVSAYIRLRAAGLGCADWPACYGRLPAPAAPWFAAAAHRAAAALLGVLILAMALTAWRRAGRRETVIALALLALTLALAALGLQTPAPTRPWVTLGNIVGAMAMLALLVPWLVPRPLTHAPRWRPWTALAVVLLFVEIALGAWLSAHYAAAACPGLLACGAAQGWASVDGSAFDLARTLPVVDGAIRPVATAPFIHMIHRLGAAAVFLYLGVLGLLAWRRAPAARRCALALLVLLGLQTTLGITMVALGFPLILAVAHNAGAAMLLAAAVRLHQAAHIR